MPSLYGVLAQLTWVDAVVVLLSLVSCYLIAQSQKQLAPPMVVDKIFIYPIKTLRGIEVNSARVGLRGFELDRCFALASPLKEGGFKLHATPRNPINVTLVPSISADGQTLTITASSGETFSLPIKPSIDGLAEMPVDLFSSGIQAYDIGNEASAFFSKQCGVESRLVYTGPVRQRKVLGSFARGKPYGLSFTDMANFLVTSKASHDDFDSQLGRHMGVIPFRPNLVMAAASPQQPLVPWAEDYWDKITVGNKVKLHITANCPRCVSLNIDYDTGKPIVGQTLPLAILAKKRRVDTGTKYSGIFGRYAYTHTSEGMVITKGDPVVVNKLYKKMTVFDWQYSH